MGDEERRFFEARSGTDLSHVRIHDDARAAAKALEIGAIAFTAGNGIGFAEQAYRPDTAAGRHLIAHELAHVVLAHEGVRRLTDEQLIAVAEREEKREQERRAQEERHQAWSGGVERQFRPELAAQPGTIGGERDRLSLALLAQKAAAIDAVTAGQGWLLGEMTTAGYAGPGLAEVKQAWANALLAVETVRVGASKDEVTSDAKLAALEEVPTFYSAVEAFSRGAERAHHDHVTAVNAQLSASYRAKLAEYQRAQEMDRLSQGPIGEPGERAARASIAVLRGSPPSEPTYLTEPAAISPGLPAARSRLYAADTSAQWAEVSADVNRIGNGFSNLVMMSLPPTSDIRRGAEYMEQLTGRLEALEKEHPLAVRIPAVFYPLDKTVKGPEGSGQEPVTVESIPWQFYLINTAVTSLDMPARSEGEWVLIDLTSSQRFENREPAEAFDSMRLQQGNKVDPPISLFSHLNSRIRFPEGRLYFTLPSGQSYVLRTTEPWSLSDWLTAVGIALAAIAIVAGVIATGGAAAPGAVAFYAGLGAAAAGVGSTLAGLHEKSQQGILTRGDIDEAMISIGIDLITAVSLGLTRLVTLPAAAARLGVAGERFLVLQKAAQVARGGVFAGDLYQAWSFTSSFVKALSALENQPGLTDEERRRMRGELIRRALLTGALLTVALRGDAHEIQAGRAMRVSHVDADGALVVHPHEPGVHPEPGVHAHEPAGHAGTDAAPHAQVVGGVEAAAERAGAGMKVGPQTHGLGFAGEGRTRDLYFCSDRCTPIIFKMEAMLETVPRGHPEREVIQDLLSRARGARQRLRSGKLTPEAADEIARQISDDIARHSKHSELFSALMNTDPQLLRTHAPDIRRRLGRDLDIQTSHLAIQSERQAANRGSRVSPDPETGLPARSPLEVDVLGGLSMSEVQRAKVGPQRLEFDAGIFAHTYAEVLVPGLPRGLSAEVRVILPDGSIGRADRVRFIPDKEGNIIGAHVFEIKPNIPDQIAKGHKQAEGYVAGLRAEIESNLRAKGKTIPTTAPDGSELYATRVVTYDFEQMLSVLRAIRSAKADAAQMAQLEAIARSVFGKTP